MLDNNPLRIFTKAEIEKLSPETLIKFRKEKLLLFQMTEKYTVKLNGHEVDKNTVIAIFSDLEQTLEDHLFQHKVPEVQEFLAATDLSKFHLLLKVNFNQMSPNNKASILDSISSKIDQQLAQDIIKGKIGPVNLKKITTFTKRHLGDDISKAYTRAYSELNEYVKDLYSKHEQPYKDSYLNSTKLHPEVESILQNKFYERLAALPDLFEPIKMSFARWCHVNVLQNAFERTTEFRRFSKSALRALREAMYVAANYFHPKHHRDNARMVTTFLNGTGNSRSGGGGSGCGGFGLVIGIILFLIKFAVLFNRCNRDSYSSGYNSSNYSNRYGTNSASQRDQETYDLIQKMIKERQERALKNTYSDRNNSTTKNSNIEVMVEEEALPTAKGIYPRGGTSVRSVKVLKDYAGTNKTTLDAVVKRIEHKEDMVEVYFGCDALPMYHQSYSRLIPDEIKEKYKGKVLDAVFIFEHNRLKNASTHVSLKIDLKGRSSYPPTSFGFVKKVTEQQKKLHVKKIKTANFNFKGYRYEYDLGETEYKSRKSFNVKFDVNRKSYIYSEPGSRAKPIKLDEINKTGTSYFEDEDLSNTRFASLLNNVKLIQDKYLRQASIYTIPKSTYCTTTDRKPILSTFVKDGILKMYITSKGDGYTYAELVMDNSHVNYIIDETGYIKTVQQVTYDRNNKIVERIIMTR